MDANRHRSVLKVWLAVMPTLTVLQLALGDLLEAVPQLMRPPVMATLAVPIVIYALMPLMERFGRAAAARPAGTTPPSDEKKDHLSGR